MPTSDNTRTPKTPSTRTAKKKTTPAGAAAKIQAATVRAAAAPKTITAPVAMPKPQVATPATPEAAAPSAPSAPVVASPAPRPVPVMTGLNRPDPAIAKVIDGDERRRMIAEAAYHKFLLRGPGAGTPTQDWMEAEAEIDALLEHDAPRTQ